MVTTLEVLNMCKIVVDALAVNRGFSYNLSSMIELSNHIAVAIEREKTTPLEPRQSKKRGNSRKSE